MFFGRLLDAHWDGTVRAGVKVYSIANFNLATTMFPLAIVISILAALCLKERIAARFIKRNRSCLSV